jgi:thiamine transport system ATP-binding protein
MTLVVEGAVVRFGDRTVVDAVDLSVAAGETVAVLGPSGCGKTTLLRAIAGLQALDAGRIAWNGADVRTVPPHERDFGFMFQEYALFPHRNVAGNVAFGLRMHGVDAAARAARIAEVLELVGLRDFGDRAVATLSGGEQQRVALARALAVAPRLLLLDEPLGALDRVWRAQLTGDIRALLDRSEIPAVYVTHDHTEAFALASRVVIMRRGRVVQRGTPKEIWRRPADPWVAAFLGFGRSVPATIANGHLITPWGTVSAPPATAADGAGALVLRPDAVRMDTNGQIRAVVVRTHFDGAATDVVAQPETGPPLAFSVASRDAPAAGDALSLSFDSDALCWYPPDSPGAESAS